MPDGKAGNPDIFKPVIKISSVARKNWVLWISQIPPRVMAGG